MGGAVDQEESVLESTRGGTGAISDIHAPMTSRAVLGRVRRDLPLWPRWILTTSPTDKICSDTSTTLMQGRRNRVGCGCLAEREALVESIGWRLEHWTEAVRWCELSVAGILVVSMDEDGRNGMGMTF